MLLAVLTAEVPAPLPDSVTDDWWFKWLTIIAAVGAALAVLHRWVMRPLVDLMRAVRLFLEDWHGTPARPGVPGRLGAMQRLAQLEANGGESIKDKVDRTHTRLDQVWTVVETLRDDRTAQWDAIHELTRTVRHLADAGAGARTGREEDTG